MSGPADFEAFCRERGLEPMVYGGVLAARNPKPWEGLQARPPGGPWDDEPDYATWTTAAGLPGLVVRNRLGALCGYAGVPPGHSAYGKGYDEVLANVHGGLTFAGECHGPICHPAPPDAPTTWWLGFDCAHSCDIIPAMDNLTRDYGWPMAYRDLAYVMDQVEGLAQQLTGGADADPQAS